jgi:hypothetical protein
MTPEKAMIYAREDIAELRRAPTHSDCLALHAAIIGYCRALLDCGLISAMQQKKLIDEAGLELANWQASTEHHHHASD